MKATGKTHPRVVYVGRMRRRMGVREGATDIDRLGYNAVDLTLPILWGHSRIADT